MLILSETLWCHTVGGLVNNELKLIWKEAFVAHLMYYHLPGKTEENYEEIKSRLSVTAKIQIKYLQNACML
jgi:hypothetical protein